jgi:hypothetical protein
MTRRPPSIAGASNAMKAFWDGRARDDAHFYIATWTGYRRPRSDAYFEPPAATAELLTSHGVVPIAITTCSK